MSVPIKAEPAAPGLNPSFRQIPSPAQATLNILFASKDLPREIENPRIAVIRIQVAPNSPSRQLPAPKAIAIDYPNDANDFAH
jgi:hypothetical protein